jgi:hypothetical protein
LDIVEAAASTAEGRRRFAAECSNTGALDARGPGEFEVRTVDLARWLASLKSSALVLKMDIEGEETHVLPKALSALPPRSALFLETHGGAAGWDAAAGALRAAGMEVVRTRERGQFIDGFASRNP